MTQDFDEAHTWPRAGRVRASHIFPGTEVMVAMGCEGCRETVDGGKVRGHQEVRQGLRVCVEGGPLTSLTWPPGKAGHACVLSGTADAPENGRNGAEYRVAHRVPETLETPMGNHR